MADFIVCSIVATWFSASCYYIYKEKKKGTKCIGCPLAGQCTKHHS